MNFPFPNATFVNAPGWTDERVARLKEVYKDGLSCSQIAALLGFVSRNAVIGKVHRLGLERRGSNYSGNQRSKPGRKPQPRVERSPVIQFRPKVRHESPELKAMRCAEIEPLHIGIDALTFENCHWPYGDGPFTFCGHISLKGRSYCEAHFALSTKPTKGISA